MKNAYVAPEIDVIAIDAITAISASISTGDIDVPVAEGFF